MRGRARRIEVNAEPRRLPSTHVARLDAVIPRIRPNDAELAGWYERYARQHRRRLAADLWLVERSVAPGARILDCGAVPLLATRALAELGFRVRGVDLAPDRFATAIDSLGLDIAACDIEREPLPFADAAFDAVLFNELFEHLRINPIATLREVRRVLVPGGKLFLSTPNLRSLRGLKNLLLHNQAHAASGDVFRQYEKLESLGHMGHVREYTTREVCDFLDHIGLRVDTLVYRGGHGRGPVGLVERMFPTTRPFFTAVASKTEPGAPEPRS